MNAAARQDVKAEKLTKDTSCTSIFVSKHHSGRITSSRLPTDRNSLLLQDAEDDRLRDDKAVWVHHAILSAYLSYTGGRHYCTRDDHLKMNDFQLLWLKAEHVAANPCGRGPCLTDYVVSDLLCDGDRPHSIRRDVLSEDGHCIFLYTWKIQTDSRSSSDARMKGSVSENNTQHIHVHNYYNWLKRDPLWRSGSEAQRLKRLLCILYNSDGSSFISTEAECIFTQTRGQWSLEWVQQGQLLITHSEYTMTCYCCCKTHLNKHKNRKLRVK